MQTCFRCEKNLADEAFTKNAARESGLSVYCRACTKEMRQERSGKPKDWVRKTVDLAAYMREYEKRVRRENPEKAHAIDREKYLRKMRNRYGPDWAPRKKLPEEELRKRRREREKKKRESKKERAKTDPVLRQKMLARKTLQNHVFLGKITPEPCNVCGEKAEAHHPAYDRPLLVVWLCPACHRAAHAVTKGCE